MLQGNRVYHLPPYHGTSAKKSHTNQSIIWFKTWFFMSDTADYIGGDLLYKINNHCQVHLIFLNFAKPFD